LVWFFVFDPVIKPCAREDEIMNPFIHAKKAMLALVTVGALCAAPQAQASFFSFEVSNFSDDDDYSASSFEVGPQAAPVSYYENDYYQPSYYPPQRRHHRHHSYGHPGYGYGHGGSYRDYLQQQKALIKAQRREQKLYVKDRLRGGYNPQPHYGYGGGFRGYGHNPYRVDSLGNVRAPAYETMPVR
jgi:hypothetical protein